MIIASKSVCVCVHECKKWEKGSQRTNGTEWTNNLLFASRCWIKRTYSQHSWWLLMMLCVRVRDWANLNMRKWKEEKNTHNKNQQQQNCERVWKNKWMSYTMTPKKKWWERKRTYREYKTNKVEYKTKNRLLFEKWKLYSGSHVKLMSKQIEGFLRFNLVAFWCKFMCWNLQGFQVEEGKKNECSSFFKIGNRLKFSANFNETRNFQTHSTHNSVTIKWTNAN